MRVDKHQMAKIESKNNKAQKKSSFVWLGTCVIFR